LTKNRVLVLAETIDLDSSSAGKARNAFIQSLVSSAFFVKVFHYSHKKVQINGVVPILISENKKDVFYVLSRAQRILQRLSGYNFSKLLENKFGFSFTFTNDVNSIVSVLRKEEPADYDLIITLSKGASYRTHAALLKLPQWHGKWLAYVHDPYPFHWYPKPYNWQEAGAKHKEFFFNEVANKARWLGYPSQKLAEWMGKFNRRFMEKAVILPHQSSNLLQIKKVPSFFEFEKFTVVHAGNLLKQRNPFPLIEAWQLFLNRSTDAKRKSQLLLLGPASYHESGLSERCCQIESIYRSDGYVNYAEVRAIERDASVNIVLEAKAKISPFLPAKFPGLIEANRLILHLGPHKSEVRRLLGGDYKYATEADNVEEIAKHFSLLFKLWKNSPKELELNRKDLEDYFLTEKLAKEIEYLCVQQNL
tara:strand:+ start:197 stop:1456 length:1260 start_codon:yes stop_codon:yes gene_type:complete